VTGKELLKTLQDMNTEDLNYIVLIGINEAWAKLEGIKTDNISKTIDMQGMS
jgi:hypothetical protein